MSSIEVCVRMRPMLSRDEQVLERQRIIFQEKQRQVKVELSQQKEKIFKFNHVFDGQVEQNSLYSEAGVEKLVQRVVQGYHSTIFAYGQTGSGKTYTIEGLQSQQKEGIIPRAIRDLFRSLSQRGEEADNTRGFRIYLSFIQIYNESIYDLIDPGDGKPLRMRWNKLQQFTVQNLFECQCRNEEDAIRWWKKGQKNKIMGSHKMNNASSRSHCILTLRVHSYSLEDPSEQIESKLQIIDLAGSERQKVTKSEGIVFREGIEINKSLFTLRQVITSLYETSTAGKPSTMAPYRESKLTCLLKQSIGGNSYCLMIACLNPSGNHFEESLQTLTYASMASYINNAPTINVDPKVQQNEQLKQNVLHLSKQIGRLEDHIRVLTDILQNNECLECRRRKENGSFAESKEPTGVLSLPKINKGEKVLSSEDFSRYNVEGESKGTRKTIKTTQDIIQSITMIKDLITGNSLLREKVEFYKKHMESQEKEMFSLMKENQGLREKIDYSSEEITRTFTEPATVVYEHLRMQLQSESDLNNLKMKLKSYNSSAKHNKSDAESKSKVSYNQFLLGRRGDRKRSNKKRINSESKKTQDDL